MTATYERSGLKFLYPENWTITDDEMDTIPRTISLQAPSGAFWSVTIHPFSVREDDLRDEALAAMKAEYDEVEVVECSESIADTTATGFDLSFYCLDFLVAARIRTLQFGHATYLLMTQAEDRDFDALEAVFQAITISLLTSSE